MENATINSNGAGDDEPEVQSAAKEPITGEITYFTQSVVEGYVWLMVKNLAGGVRIPKKAWTFWHIQSAISGLDGRNYYDYIKTGHQDGGLAIVNGIDEEVYVKKRPCVYKHLKALAKACSCRLKIHEDEDFILVGASALERIRRFRNAVERCILEDIDPEAHAKELHDKFRQDRTLNNTIQTVKDLKI